MSENITLRDYLASESPEFRVDVERGARKLIQEVEDFQAIRVIAALSQPESAQVMPTDLEKFARVERHAQVALQTLRRFVAQAGGELDVTIHLPGQRPIHLDKISDNASHAAAQD